MSLGLSSLYLSIFLCQVDAFQLRRARHLVFPRQYMDERKGFNPREKDSFKSFFPENSEESNCNRITLDYCIFVQ